VSADEAPEALNFGSRARFLCDVGYEAEAYSPPSVGSDAQEEADTPFTYIRSSDTYCVNNLADNIRVVPGVSEEECKHLCNANSTCSSLERTCDGRCILLARCDDKLRSTCGSATFTKKFLDPERLLEFQCEAYGMIANSSGTVCLPKCGDGRLVDITHLPMYYAEEQCDDGNLQGGDGCSPSCRVEPGFVCRGGGPDAADACEQSDLFVESRLWLSISGNRLPLRQELRLASEVALAWGLGCHQRDLEIFEVHLSPDKENEAPFDSVGIGGATLTSTTTTTVLRSRYHSQHVEVELRFKVKISDPRKITIDDIQGTLERPSMLKPKLMVAYADRTSLSDLYVTVVNLGEVTVDGDLALGRIKSDAFELSDFLWTWSVRIGPGMLYLSFVFFVTPALYYAASIRKREYRLMGRYTEIEPKYIGRWTFSFCTWMEHKAQCLTLFLCLPARVADTWDSIGLMPYWTGVQQAMCCCTMYLCGCCVCAAWIPAKQRSEMRDFFDMGDKVKGNVERRDFFQYLFCPLCCIIQEAMHTDAALDSLPEPVEDKQRIAEELYAKARAEEEETKHRVSIPAAVELGDNIG